MTEEHKRKISEARKGQPHPHKGAKRSVKTREKISLTKISQSPTVSYGAAHQWVRQWKGKASHCEVCGCTDKKRYNWANVDHKYRRVLNDYISMCVLCHVKYDKEHNGKYKK